MSKTSKKRTRGAQKGIIGETGNYKLLEQARALNALAELSSVNPLKNIIGARIDFVTPKGLTTVTTSITRQRKSLALHVDRGPAVYLGGKATLPLKTEADYIGLIRKGITKRSVDHLMETTNMPEAEMAEIMEITVKKLAAIKPDSLMEKAQSEKAVNIARLYSLGEEVFGSVDEFNKWMNGLVPSLGKKMPKAYLDTGSGINLLMDELVRIQHGVYS